MRILSSSFLLALALASASVQADTGLPVYGIVLSSLGAAIGGDIMGNGWNQVLNSGINKSHQVSLMAGQDKDIDALGFSYRLNANKPLWQHKYFVLNTGLEGQLSHWQAKDKYAYRGIDDLGLTPMFTIKQTQKSPWYAEVGVGVHLLSGTRIKDYDKSTQFQFGDQFGLGWDNQEFRVGYRYLHVSNGNIEIPNPSTDFHSIELGFRY